MKRTATLVAILVVTSVLAGVTAAATGDQVRFGGDQTPTWHVNFEEGHLSDIESWANSSDSRSIIRTHNESEYVLVEAPASDVGKTLLSRLLSNGLRFNGYVESISPNIELEYAEPVTLEDEDAVSEPGRLATVMAAVGESGASWSPDGIAYGDDVETSTQADVMSVIGHDDVSVNGTGATIAVIDTGVNTADGEVFGNGTEGSDTRILNASKDFLDNETVDADGIDAVEDPNGHGTWVAAAAAANHSNASYDGVAPGADILALRVLNSEGSGSSGDISAAIRYAADNDADVIAMSLGSPVYDSQMVNAIDYALSQNVTAVTIAAGNSRLTTRWLGSPADAPLSGVTAVTATNTSENDTAASAYFANTGPDPGTTDGSEGKTRGEEVTVGAPGMSIEAKVPGTGGAVRTGRLSGTSMAQPYVAGAAALGIDANADWVDNATGFRDAVRDTARPMPNAAAAEVGGGLLAVDRLVNNQTSGSQESAMDTEAEARNAFWEGIGDTENLFQIDALNGILG